MAVTRTCCFGRAVAVKADRSPDARDTIGGMGLRVLWWRLVLAWVDRIARLTPRRPGGVRRRVLVVRLDAIGDFVLWLDAAAVVRELFPKERCEITLLGNQVWTELAQAVGLFDRVWSLDRRRFVLDPRYRLRVLRAIREAGFDVVLHPTYSRDFLWGDSVLHASGARERIGFDGDRHLQTVWSARTSSRWYTRLVESAPGPAMELIRNAQFVRALGAERFRAGRPRLTGMALAPTAQLPDRFYVLFPGASKALKQWPLDRFRALAERVYARTGLSGVVCGSRTERALGAALCAGHRAPLIDLTGCTTLRELLGVFEKATVVVSNDTGAVHLAAAVGTPVVTVVGGGHFGRFLPYETEIPTRQPAPQVVAHRMPCYGCGWNCIFPLRRGLAAPCVTDVSIDEVWDAVRPWLVGEPSESIRALT